MVTVRTCPLVNQNRERINHRAAGRCGRREGGGLLRQERHVTGYECRLHDWRRRQLHPRAKVIAGRDHLRLGFGMPLIPPSAPNLWLVWMVAWFEEKIIIIR